MIYLVSFDLIKQKDYARIDAAIQAQGRAVKVLFSQWLVQSPLTAGLLLRELVKALDSDDRMIVSEVTRNTASRNVLAATENMQKWLEAGRA